MCAALSSLTSYLSGRCHHFAVGISARNPGGSCKSPTQVEARKAPWGVGEEAPHCHCCYPPWARERALAPQKSRLTASQTSWWHNLACRLTWHSGRTPHERSPPVARAVCPHPPVAQPCLAARRNRWSHSWACSNQPHHLAPQSRIHDDAYESIAIQAAAKQVPKGNICQATEFFCGGGFRKFTPPSTVLMGK